MPYDIDADIAAYAVTAEARRTEAEARETVDYYHQLALSEVPDEDPFAEIMCDGAQLPDWDERHVYKCAVDRVGRGAACPTHADIEEMGVEAYNRKVLKHMNVHATGSRFIPPPYFYDKDGKRVSR